MTAKITTQLNYLDGYSRALRTVIEIIENHEQGLRDALLCRITYDDLKKELQEVFRTVEKNHKVIESLTLEEFLNQWKTSSILGD